MYVTLILWHEQVSTVIASTSTPFVLQRPASLKSKPTLTRPEQGTSLQKSIQDQLTKLVTRKINYSHPQEIKDYTLDVVWFEKRGAGSKGIDIDGGRCRDLHLSHDIELREQLLVVGRNDQHRLYVREMLKDRKVPGQETGQGKNKQSSGTVQ